MKKRWVLDQTVRHTIEETWAVFTKGTITPNPALFLARLAALARSNAFLWTEAGLQMQEHATRVVPVGQSLSRSLVLAEPSAYRSITTLPPLGSKAASPSPASRPPCRLSVATKLM